LALSQNFEKSTMSFVMFVRLSVGMEQVGCNWKDFHKNPYMDNFLKSVEKIQVSFKSDQNNRYFTT
jgi:hypothetical protein